jgi:hypothetical protein
MTSEIRDQILQSWLEKFAPANLALDHYNGELLNTYIRARYGDQLSVEILVKAANNLANQLHYLAVSTPPVKKDRRSFNDRLMDAGIRPESGRATPADREADAAKSKGLADKLKSDVAKVKRVSEYKQRVNDAEAEASMLPHSKRSGRLAVLMAQIRRDFPDIAA